MSPNDSTDLDRLEDLTQAIVSLAKLDFSVQLNVQGSSPLDHDRWSGNGAEPELHATPWLAGPSMFSVPAPRVRASRGPIRRTTSKTMPATASLPTSAPTEDLPLLVKRDVLVAWWHEDTAYSDNHLYKCYAAILRKAFAHGATSLVLPILGGRGGVKAANRARVVCDLLRQFHKLKPSGSFPVNRLIFAGTDPATVTAIEEELDRRLYLP